MIETSDLKPLQRQCLLACVTAPEQKLVRSRGGFAPASNRNCVFTTRTVRGLEALGLLRSAGEFAMDAELTAPGKRLAEQLRDSEHAKAGAA